MRKNYYLILGVTNDASPDELKAAFRRRALELHPDRSGRDSEPFLEVQEAYGVLGDSQRRTSYDREISRAHSERYVRPPAEPLVPGRTAKQAGVQRRVSLNSYEHYAPSFDELFARWWGNFGGLARPKSDHLESLMVEVVLSYEEAIFGGKVRVMVPARAICPTCSGHGSLGGYECWRCEGHGALTAECPVDIEYPSGVQDRYALRFPLTQFGIANFYLTVCFRVPGSHSLF